MPWNQHADAAGKGLGLVPIAFDPVPLLTEIRHAEKLWNDFDLRTNHPQSPHREMDDIIVRYNARENFSGDRHAFNERHDSVWWDSAAQLSSVFPMVFDLMRFLEGEQLGMVLITRQPSGATCYPHVDIGWHARHYDKYAIQLRADEGQSFHVEDEILRPAAGQCFFFDNSRKHCVINNSMESRMTMIVCIRTRFTKRV